MGLVVVVLGREMPNDDANFAGAKMAWSPVKRDAEAKMRATARKLKARVMVAMSSIQRLSRGIWRMKSFSMYSTGFCSAVFGCVGDACCLSVVHL